MKKSGSGMATALLGIALVLLFSASARATPVAPNQNNVVPTVLSGSPGQFLTSIKESVTAPTFTAIVRAAVYRNSSGTLDFYYQVTNTSGAMNADSLARLTGGNFTGFDTSVFYRTDGAALGHGFVNGNDAPNFGDRDGTGRTVGFSFSEPANRILPQGQSSFVLVISTNAVNYANGLTGIIDSTTETVGTFGPIGKPVPEPASMVLLGTGLAGLAAGLRKRRKKQT